MKSKELKKWISGNKFDLPTVPGGSKIIRSRFLFL